MNNELKFYLLAEKSGWDCSAYAFKYKENYTSSKAYQILTDNSFAARSHLSSKAKNIVHEFETVNFEPHTLSEAFVLETRLNYLALHSFPEYYLNPLAIDPNYKGEVTSIGELMFTISGKDMSLNEMIMDEEIDIEEKKRVVYDQIDEYLTDMNHLVDESISIIRQRAFSKEKDKPIKAYLITLFDNLLFALLNLALGFVFLYPFTFYRQCFNAPNPGYLLSYLSYIFPWSILINDIVFAFYHSYKATLSAPYNYARRFLKHKSKVIFDDLKHQADNLADYIVGAINTKNVLKDDILEFSKLSSSYIDFKKVLNVSALLKRKDYQILHITNNVVKTFAVIITVLTIVCCLLSVVFQTAF